MTDFGRCTSLLAGLCPDVDRMVGIVVKGEPRSKARPRFSGNGHVYSSEKQVAAEKELAWRMKARIKEPLKGNLALACIFFRSTHGRIDVDNMLKHVMDAANGVCWKDDYQVTAILGVVEFDKENPRTVLAIAPHASTLSRAEPELMPCKRCGKQFIPRLRRSSRSTTFCSTLCASLSRGVDLRAEIPCVWCQQYFRRQNSRQAYCSDACRLQGLHAKMPERRKTPCVGCGVILANPHSKRCRACWKLSKKDAA